MQLPVWDLAELGNLILTGLVVFFLQKLFESRINRDLEQFRNTIQVDTYIHQRRVEAILEIYKRLSQIRVIYLSQHKERLSRADLQKWIATGDPHKSYKAWKEAKDEELVVLMKEFENSLAENSILFSTNLTALLNNFDQFYKKRPKAPYRWSITKESRIELVKYFEEYFEMIEARFRRILGVTTKWESEESQFHMKPKGWYY